MSAPDLATLIADAKGDRSYDQISRAAGGAPTPERLQQLATGPIKAFPSPDTIRALARGLNVPTTEVVAAISRSLGLDVHLGGDPGALVLADANSLPDSARQALRLVAAEMLQLHQAVNPAEERDGHGDAAPTTERAPATPASAAAPAPSAVDASVGERAAAEGSATTRGPKVVPVPEHPAKPSRSTGRRSHGHS